MEAKLVLVFLATILAISPSSHANSFADQINNFIVMPHESGDLRRPDPLNCLGWRLAVETNNLRGWKMVPSHCKSYIGNYMTKDQHNLDCEVATDAAYDYAKTIPMAKDGRDVWVLDIGQTSLSLLEYYARPDVQFGTVPFNSTNYEEWHLDAKMPAVPGVLDLYEKLLELGFKIVFISASSATQDNIEGKAEDLRRVGYHTWEKLILKKESENGLTVAAYKAKKRTELVVEGYRIRGNMGDQWSDLSHPNAGDRTFKLPNPMFYIA